MTDSTDSCEQLFRQLALESFTNCQALYNDAVLLAENQRGARAVALAIIGTEEFAKAMVYTVGALIPDKRQAILEAINKGLRIHDVKHLAARYAEAAQIAVEEGWTIALQGAGFWPDSASRLEDMLIQLGRLEISEVVTSRKEASKFFKELGSPSRLKEDALYVGFVGGKIKTPGQVASQAQSEIASLKFYLDEYKVLPDMLTNQEAWNTFAQTVRNKIAETK
jgi:AbiV family abortive infection protein